MEPIKLLLVSSLLSLLFGQIIRVPLFSSAGAFTLTDLLVILCDFVFLIYFLTLKKTLRIKPKVFILFALFSLSAISSSVLSLNLFAPIQVLISSFFLLRFASYFFLSIVIFNLIQKEKIDSWIHLVIFVCLGYLFLGFLQLFFYPDLSSLTAFGWDPHQKRIVSTFLDPNFSGFVFDVLIALSLSLYIFKKKFLYLTISGLALAGLFLTFSRSSYLGFFGIIGSIGLLKSPKTLIAGLLIFILAIFSVPKIKDRVVGAFTLDDTAQARIGSWSNGSKIFRNNLLFGVGFNNYRLAQESYGFFSYDNPQGGHSGSGVDSSLLLVAATTGIVGFSLFAVLLFSVFHTLLKKIRQNWLNLATFSIFLGLLVHSEFVNSFFFPQIMLLFWFLFGLTQVNDS